MTTSTQIRSPIHGMTCSACATRIEKALRRIDGIETIAVNFATENADIAFDSSKLASSDVADAIAATGYSIDDTAFSFEIGGMTCSACANRIEKALLKVPGVLEACGRYNLALILGLLGNACTFSDPISKHFELVRLGLYRLPDT